MPFKPNNAVGKRGKSEEQAVQDFLEALGKRAKSFDWMRYPDARSAMGRMKSMPADFEFCMPGRHGLIEVKAVAHDYRIAKDKVAQLPRLKKRELAGGDCFVLVHHTSCDAWRIVRAAQLESGAPSWDLSKYATFATAEAALLSTGVFVND